MKRFCFLLALASLFAVTAHAVTCTSTGFIRDGINLTAAMINPTVVTGEVDATGCNIGVYIDNVDATIMNANIHGANYFGVVVNGDVNTPSASISYSFAQPAKGWAPRCQSFFLAAGGASCSIHGPSRPGRSAQNRGAMFHTGS